MPGGNGFSRAFAVTTENEETKMTDIIIQGIGGRMGHALCEMIANRSDCRVVAGIGLVLVAGMCFTAIGLCSVSASAIDDTELLQPVAIKEDSLQPIGQSVLLADVSEENWYEGTSGSLYYCYADGTYATGITTLPNEETYLFALDGTLKTGWQTIDGVDYYFESWGGMRVNAWAAKGSDWYYMDSNGTPKGEGWLLYDKNWYYLRQDGKMMHSEWLWYDNNWYYLQSWGGMYKSQWVTIKGATYYFRSWGGIYKNGWQEVDGKTYYFRSWGGIYKDTYIDGYYVDKNGVRRNSKNICVAIDAGHQRRGNSEKEPIGPGSSTYKAKVASGTCGVATGINEYELNLAVSLKVRDILEERGYDVYMIRETHDVNISNSERAKLAAQNGADILVRVHANGDSNQSVYGALTMAPSSRNTYLSGDVISKSQKLSQKMIAAFCKDTGAKNRDVIYTDSMSGINWSTIPVTIIELGFMSNPSEDRLMATEDYRNKMAQGIADGIDAYYE